MQSANLVQRLVLPTPTTPEPLLYARMSGNVRIVDNGAVLTDDGTLSFDTTFGVFAAGRWRRVSQEGIGCSNSTAATRRRFADKRVAQRSQLASVNRRHLLRACDSNRRRSVHDRWRVD